MKTSFILTLYFLLPSCVSTGKKIDCEMFRRGQFEFQSKLDSSITTIERNDSIQIETNNKTGLVTKARIKWTANCEYELTYIDQTASTTDTIVSFVKGRLLKTEILQTSEYYYIFKSSMEGTSVILVDTMKLAK